jgi:hypothetical protein
MTAQDNPFAYFLARERENVRLAKAKAAVDLPARGNRADTLRDRALAFLIEHGPSDCNTVTAGLGRDDSCPVRGALKQLLSEGFVRVALQGSRSKSPTIWEAAQ